MKKRKLFQHVFAAAALLCAVALTQPVGATTIASAAATSDAATAADADPCHNCSGVDVEIENVTFSDLADCQCVATKSITIKSGVVIEGKAKVRFIAPKIKIQSYFNAKSGSEVNIVSSAIEPDIYEIDDTYSQASVIDIDDPEVQSHNFYYEGDPDWTAFYGLSGETYVLKTQNPGSNCDTVIDLYDGDGATLLDSKDAYGKGEGESFNFDCAKDSIYYVKVHEYYSDFGENTEYELRVYKPEAPFIGSLAGVIKGLNCEGIIPMAVVLTDEGGSALSRHSGAYSIFHYPGTVTVTVTATGYNTESVSGVVIYEGQRTILNFCLTPVVP